MQHAIVEELGRIPMAPNLAATLVRAAEAARVQPSGTVALEHLLLALTEDPDAAAIFQVSKLDVARLRHDIETHLRAATPAIPPGQPVGAAISPDLKRVLEAAAAAAQQGRRREINGAIVLAAIVGDGRSAAAEILRHHGLTFEEAIKALQRAAQTAATRPQPKPPAPVAAPAVAPPTMPDATSTVPPAPPSPPATPPVPAPAPAPQAGDHRQSTEELLATVRERIATQTPRTRPPASGNPEAAAAPTAQSLPPRETGMIAVDARTEPVRSPPPPMELQHDETTRPPPQVLAPPQPSSAPYAPQWETAEMARPAPSREGTAGMHRPQSDPVYEAAPPLPQSPSPSYQHGAEAAAPYGGAQPPTPPASRPALRTAPPPMPETTRPPQPPAAAPWPEPAAARRPPAAPLPTPPLGPAAGLPAPHDGPRPGERPLAGRSAPPAAPARAGPPPQPQMGGKERRAATPAIEPGQLVENIPRKMRTGIPAMVEVRIGRDRVQGLARGMAGVGPAQQHSVMVTRAMSVRLRAPDGGFFIETASPETQWIDNTLGVHADDFASWRWTVTPNARGLRRLQLIVSARTVGSDGLAAETALPDQVIDVRVRVNYASAARKVAGWVLAAILGGALAKFGESGLDAARALLKSLSGT